MNVIILLGLILWGLMWIYGGKSGHKTFISLIINLFTLFVFVFFLRYGVISLFNCCYFHPLFD